MGLFVHSLVCCLLFFVVDFVLFVLTDLILRSRHSFSNRALDEIARMLLSVFAFVCFLLLLFQRKTNKIDYIFIIVRHCRHSWQREKDKAHYSSYTLFANIVAAPRETCLSFDGFPLAFALFASVHLGSVQATSCFRLSWHAFWLALENETIELLCISIHSRDSSAKITRTALWRRHLLILFSENNNFFCHFVLCVCNVYVCVIDSMNISEKKESSFCVRTVLNAEHAAYTNRSSEWQIKKKSCWNFPNNYKMLQM